MIRYRNELRQALLASMVMVAGLLGHQSLAEAKTHHAPAHRQIASRNVKHPAHARRVAVAHHPSHGWKHEAYHAPARHGRRYAARGHGTWMQCVPYARRVSGIELTGDAYRWWAEADGVYERGQTPEAGAVLSFKSAPGMRLGHVAVVTETITPRKILVTQAHWPTYSGRRGDISRSISVIDVSAENDWSAVRVELGHSGNYGSVYPANGFIYAHAPDGSDATLMADAAAPGATVPATSKGKTAFWSQTVQFAAAPSFGGPAIEDSAPDRSLR